VSNWSSPFPLSADLRKQLEVCGIQRHKGDPSAVEDSSLLLIYRHPASILGHWQCSDAKPLKISTLQKGYKQLLEHRTHGHLVADWRLRGLKTDQILNWLDGGAAPATIARPSVISPLCRLVLLELFRSQPELVDLYQDLELHAELFGSQADSELQQRLQQSCDANELLEEWCSPRRADQSWGNDAERLQRLEHELEHYVLLSREQQQMLKEQNEIGDRALHLASDIKGTVDSD
tara:strand:- start:450 stop:1151 length:702 start_codon:yes stop_codon:yes gene_type:complete